MLKQSGSRNQRYKGFKVKHVVQICALLALCVWLLNQVRDTYDKTGTGIFQRLTSEHGAIKLGRKDLDGGLQQGNNEGGEVEVEDEVEESKPEEIEDEHEHEKVEVEESEDVEDLIDEEDREKENQIEDLSLLEDQTMNEEGDQDLQDTRDDDASTSVLQLQSSLDAGIAAQIRRLTSVDQMVKNDEQRVEQMVSSFNAALPTN